VGAQTSGTLKITGAQLEPGDVATPFERLPIGETLMLCQRYFYSATNGYGFGYSPGGATRAGTVLFQSQMRTTPTLSATGLTYNNGSALTFEGITVNGSGFYLTVTAGGGYYVNFSYTAAAEL
jgi:hypothetical protein